MFLNPSVRDVLLSSLEEDAYGENAKKRRACRRHDFIDGNAKSYAKWLNAPERMQKYAEYNELQSRMAEIRADKDKERETRKQAKEKKKQEREQKKQKQWLPLRKKRQKSCLELRRNW